MLHNFEFPEYIVQRSSEESDEYLDAKRALDPEFAQQIFYLFNDLGSIPPEKLLKYT
jgi:hypothetical protein